MGIKNLLSPKNGESLLKHVMSRHDAESIAGDYEELYADKKETGNKISPLVWYWFQIIKTVWISLSFSFTWSFVMYINYMKMAFRNIRLRKGYSFINISGLSIGIASCILALLWIQFELSYNKFHKNINQIYRVVYSNSEQDWKSHVVPGALADFLKETYPEVEDATLFGKFPLTVNREDKAFYLSAFYVHPSFFKIFSFPVIAGSTEKPFVLPVSVVISEETATKYFGDEDPIGKTIRADDELDVIVEAVVSIPENSSIKFDLLCSSRIAPPYVKKWENWGPHVYVQLKKGVSYKNFNKKITNIHLEHVSHAKDIAVFIHPFAENHLHSFLGGGLITYVYVFSSMALFILLLACINFMNLTTGRAESRIREIAVKKVIGSTRMQLITQFLVESVVCVILALFSACALIALFMPFFNNILGYEIKLYYSTQIIFIIIGITLLTSIISGIYPALFLSSLKSINVLKGLIVYNNKNRSSNLRRILVIFQFSISISFIACAGIVFKQLHYIQNKDIGFDKEQVVVFPIQLGGNVQVFKEELLKNPKIESASAILDDLVYWGSTSDGSRKGKKSNQKLNFSYNWVDCDFLKTFKIELVKGRFFSPEIQSDYTDAYVINESAVNAMGVTDPIGMELFKDSYYFHPGKIIGVIKDYNFATLHREVSPICLIPNRNGKVMNVRISSVNMPETISFIGKSLKKIDPSHPFKYSFLDDKIDRQYKNEQFTAKIILFITCIAILISCLGLFGLAAFSVERRSKEIGIRKAIGASTANILKVLSKELMILVLIANIIAWPVSWYIMNKWLQNFAYHTKTELWIFCLAGFSAVVIAFLTIIKQTLKAAAGNPVDSLRYE